LSKFGRRFDIFGWKVGYWLEGWLLAAKFGGPVGFFLYVFAAGLIFVFGSCVGFVCNAM
jgi:hypothetical protein